MDQTHRQRQALRRSTRLSIWAAALFAGPALGGCDRDQPTTAAPTTEKVADHPNRYVGQHLTLTGEVDRVYGDRAFELEGNEAFFASNLLVLTRSPVRLGGEPLHADERVTVTGTVRDFVVSDLERDLSWDLNPQIEVEWKNRPAFVAESISRVREDARWSEQENERQGTLVGLVSVYYAPDVKALAGQQIELSGVKVQEPMGQGVWIGPSHANQVFVAPASSGSELPKLEAGDSVDVRGTIRQMPKPSEAIDRWKLNKTLSRQIGQESVYIEAQSLKKSSARDTTKQRTGGTDEKQQTGGTDEKH